MSEGTIRCPRCGNENSSDSFACSFCGRRLRIEKIENISFFKRIEEEWISPAPWFVKIYWLFVKPNFAFWDINHKRKTAPGYIILILNTLLWGLMGLAFASRFRFNDLALMAIFGLSFFLIFLVFGFIFNFVFYMILIWMFSKGADYSVKFSERLETRFGGVKKETYEESEMSPFSIYKSGTLMQKMEAHKYKMLMCAFTPFLLTNTIKIIIVLIALPTLNVGGGGANFNALRIMFSSPVWAVLDVIDALTMAIWVPILMALAIRELSNSSTIRVLISSLVIGVTVSIFFYFLRPTLFG